MYKAEYGKKARDNVPPVCEEPFVTFKGTCNKVPSYFSLSREMLTKNVVYLGGTGFGKTNTINMSVNQIKKSLGKDDVMIIFDTKGDFEHKFYDPKKGDKIIGNSSKYRSRSEKWNIYREILADGGDDEDLIQNISEISHSLFIRSMSAQNPFFPNAARNLFSGYLLSILRCARNNKKVRDKLMNNLELAFYFNTAQKDQYDKLINSYNDMKSLKMYLGDFNNNQALGVLAEVLNMVKDTFIGVFNQRGDFSMREFVRERGGRTLFLEYDLAIGQTLTPLYSLLLDLAIKEVLSQNEDTEGHVYIVIDEFVQAPYLRHLGDAVNSGRSRNLSIQAGLQSLNQFYEHYGLYQGGSLLAGFSTVVAFHLNDTLTREYVRDHFGQIYLREMGDPKNHHFRMGYCVEDWELNELRLGDAVVQINGQDPFCFHFAEFEKKG